MASKAETVGTLNIARLEMNIKNGRGLCFCGEGKESELTWRMQIHRDRFPSGKQGEFHDKSYWHGRLSPDPIWTGTGGVSFCGGLKF